LPSPYKVYYPQDDSLNATFTTTKGCNYSMFFSENSILNDVPELKHKIYDFSFTIEGETRGFDARIQPTVVLYLKKFLSNDKVILYTCEDKDNRGLFRKNLFSRWHSDNDDIIKKNFDFEANEYKIYATLLYKRTFDQLQIFESATDKLYKELNESKIDS